MLPYLAGFAAGATLLQFAEALPPHAAMFALAALVLACAAIARARHAAGTTESTTRLAPLLSRVHVCRARTGFAVACVAAFGYGFAAWRAEVRLADALPMAWEDVDLRVTGIVDDLPQNDAAGARFAFAVDKVHASRAEVPRRLSLAWHAPRAAGDDARAAAPQVHAGERWTLTLRLRRPHGNVNPHGFDLEAWLLERGLRATGYVRDGPQNMRVAPFVGRPGDYVQRARERIRDRVFAALPGAPYAGVLVALAIGDQRAIPEAQWTVFNKTGVTHLVSISGLHVTVFASLAGACALVLARRLPALTMRLPARKVAALVGALVAFGYVLLAGAEVPAVRTLLMLVVAALGVWLGRPGTASLVWLWSLVAVLVVDPWASLAPGFWLSFGAVGLLLYAGSNRLRAPCAKSGWMRLREGLRESVHAQWVVTLGLVPGTLALFQQVSLVSAFANALAIPVVTLGVVPLALFGIVVPVDAAWWAAHAVLAVLMRYLEWLAALPLAAWAAPAPLAWTLPIAIAGTLWLLSPRGVPGRTIGLAWMLPMALLRPPGVPEGSARMTVLDVGQGLSVVVETTRHTLVYDTGPRYNETVDAGTRIVVPFLRASGLLRIDTLIVSHADSDHSGGALAILRALPVRMVLSSLPDDHEISVAGRRTATVRRCDTDARWRWDGVDFELVHPVMDAYADASRKTNDLSCVLRVVTAQGRAALLTGDIESRSETEILARAADVRADVLVVPHHGSRTSSTVAFVDAVTPNIAVIAAGYHNRFGHPRAEIVARYAGIGAALPRTDLQGAITLSLDTGEPPAAQGERDRKRRYWYDR